jgi:hypothetical protein
MYAKASPQARTVKQARSEGTDPFEYRDSSNRKCVKHPIAVPWQTISLQIQKMVFEKCRIGTIRSWSAAQPGAIVPNAVGKVNHHMPMRSGRLVKRAPLAISIRISSLLKPYAAEHTTTENICSLGLRVLVQEARKPNELMLVNSADGELKTAARVVYCERIGDGRFALGLEFKEDITNWPQKPVGPED